jgi:hypothetical protein
MIGSPLARHASRPPNTTRRIWPASRSCLSGAGSCHHNTTSDGQRQVPDWKGEVVDTRARTCLATAPRRNATRPSAAAMPDWADRGGIREAPLPRRPSVPPTSAVTPWKHPAARSSSGRMSPTQSRRARMPILATMAETVSTGWGLMARYSASFCVAESPEHLRNRASYRSAADSRYRSPLPASAAPPCRVRYG